MKSTRPLGNRSLLLLLSSAIAAACGSAATVGQTTDAGGDASVDASADASTEASTDAGFLDALPDSSDANPDACPPGYAADGDGGCLPLTVRRPFLVGASMRSSQSSTRGDWTLALAASVDTLDAATRQALAEAWLRDGLEEHASIAAFARFTMLLLSVGAPPELVLASQRASVDEIHHARACFALAERYGEVARGPAPLPVHDSMSLMSLVQLAALTAEEGCVGETLGAALAAHQLERATDPASRRILRKIARDEARHAELAWRFVAWAVGEGGREVALAVEASVRRACASTLAMAIRSYDGIDLEAWHAHGRVTCAEAREIARTTMREVLEPCLAQLSSGYFSTPRRALGASASSASASSAATRT